MTATNRRLSALLPLLLLAAAGCGVSAATTEPADLATARQALRDTLDAWKRGAPHDAAVENVRVADDDWLAGAKLIDYRVTTEGDALGPYLRAPVVLTLRGRKGRPFRKSVVYDVTTSPGLSVVRHE